MSDPRFGAVNKSLNLENKFNVSRGKKEVEENKRERLVFPNLKMSLFLCLCISLATSR